MTKRNNTTQHKIIYDFGANRGDNLPYYLKKADLVIAVEANPTLAKTIENRFTSEINAGNLIVENCVLTNNLSVDLIPFYLHKSDHVRSQFPEPAKSELPHFEKINLPGKSVIDIIDKHGFPYYIKIDIEHYDEAILRSLFSNNIRPPFISAESLSPIVFSLMMCHGNYTSFNLVDGQTVSDKYGNTLINTSCGTEKYSFPSHSAGPFGEDISTPWMNTVNFFRYLGLEGFGWKDIHATLAIEPNNNYRPRLRNYIKRAITSRLYHNIILKYRTRTD